MAHKDPEHEEGSESLSATAMFLRALTPEQQQATPKPEQQPAASPAPAPEAGAGDFTRMFRPVLSPESKPAAPPLPPPAPPPNLTGPGSGDFTRAFVVPPSLPDQASPVVVAPLKAKGFSTPGVSDSASAEGSFTRIFRRDPQLLAPRQDVESDPKEPQFVANLKPPADDPQLDSAFFAKTEQTSPPHQSAGVTELFNKLSAGDENHSQESPYRPDPTPTPRPYVEPTLLARPEKPAEVMPPGGGVTALLNRLTGETQLPASILSDQLVPGYHEIPPPATPTDTRGEFTRIIDAAQVQAALAPGNASLHPPPASTTPLITVAPIKLPVVPPVPIAQHLPPLVPPPAPKVTISAPAIQPLAKTKLQEMVPFLLVANAFLMLILILLVAFALHKR